MKIQSRTQSEYKQSMDLISKSSLYFRCEFPVHIDEQHFCNDTTLSTVCELIDQSKLVGHRSCLIILNAGGEEFVLGFRLIA